MQVEETQRTRVGRHVLPARNRQIFPIVQPLSVETHRSPRSPCPPILSHTQVVFPIICQRTVQLSFLVRRGHTVFPIERQRIVERGVPLPRSRHLGHVEERGSLFRHHRERWMPHECSRLTCRLDENAARPWDACRALLRKVRLMDCGNRPPRSPSFSARNKLVMKLGFRKNQRSS